jgi:hypothetical protein
MLVRSTNHLEFPISCIVLKCETKDGWSFFLKNLRSDIQQSGICLISDRHESIKSAYKNPDNGWQDRSCRHVYCVGPIAQNFMRQFKVRDLRKKVINMDNDLSLISTIFYFFL